MCNRSVQSKLFDRTLGQLEKCYTKSSKRDWLFRAHRRRLFRPNGTPKNLLLGPVLPPECRKSRTDWRLCIGWLAPLKPFQARQRHRVQFEPYDLTVPIQQVSANGL